MNKKLIDKVVDKLIQSMMSAEIIKFKDSIWFIDRERHFWFFEFDTGPKHLWWRWSHFTSELKIFSINDDSENTKEIFVELFSKIINRKKFLESKYGVNLLTVSDVMNFSEPVSQVEEVLNCEVETTTAEEALKVIAVEEVLNCEVETTILIEGGRTDRVEEVLNQEVKTTGKGEGLQMIRLDEVLNQEVEMVSMKGGTECDLVENALNYEDVVVSHGEMVDEESFVKRVLEVLPDPSNNEARVDGILKNT